jgi:hypothetical protein
MGWPIAPEFACIPFKVTLGTYVEVIEKRGGHDHHLRRGWALPGGLIRDGAGKNPEECPWVTTSRMIRNTIPAAGYLGFHHETAAEYHSNQAVLLGRAFLYREIKRAWAKLVALDAAEIRVQ